MSSKRTFFARNRARTITALALTMGLTLSLLTGCGSGTTVETGAVSSAAESQSTDTALLSTTQAEENTAASAQKLNAATLFSDRDLSGDWDESSAETITLSGDTASTTSKNVTVDGSTVTIKGEGVYVLSGTLNGQIVVDADGAKVQLVLNGANITCASSAALYVKQADKVFLTLAQGTENSLTTSGEFVQTDDNNVDGVVFSKDDLTVNGSGALTVTTQNGHGIVSKDELTLAGCTLTVNASGHALSGKDCVCVASGTYNLTAGKDGIHSENADESTKGYIVIEDGTFTINAEGDGLDASCLVQLDGGKLDITAGGGSANATKKHEEFFGRHQQNAQTTESTSTTTEEETASAKGVKADQLLLVDGVTLTIDSADDALHSNADVELSSGKLTLTTGDDGVHADNALTVSGGNVHVEKSYEGLEGKVISITGGEISVTASDDGINAGGGNDSSGTQGPMGGFDQFSSQDGVSLTISGGSVTINSEGDGLDSNGTLTVTDGEVVVYGPLNSGNGAIDHNGEAIISGGTLVAVSCSNMEEGFDETSTQGTIAVQLESTVTGSLKLTDSSGKTVLDYTPAKEYSVVQLSCAALKQGETYTLTAGGQSVTIEMDSLHYGQLTGMGGRGGHGGMGKGSMDGQNNAGGPAQGMPSGKGPMGHGGKGRGGMNGSSGNQTPGSGKSADSGADAEKEAANEADLSEDDTVSA